MASDNVDFASLDIEAKLTENNKLLIQLLQRTEVLEKLKNDVLDVQNRLAKAEENFSEIADLKASVKFMSENYDTVVKDYKEVKANVLNLEKENKLLNSKVNHLHHQLKSEKAARNSEAQYHRTAINLKICGVPFQKGEERSDNVSNPTTKNIVMQLCEKAGVTVHAHEIDVCHRLGKDITSPILLRFG